MADPAPPAEHGDGERTRNEFSGVAHAIVQAGVITGGVTINTTASNVMPMPRQLPPSVFAFADRAECVAELDALLASAGTEQAPSVVISAVSGTAGVGKTALVIHWAHRVRDQFPDGHLYVDLHGYGPAQPLHPAEVLDQFLRALGLAGEDIPRELAARAARFRTLVDQRRILMILDNVGAVDQVRPLLPGTSSCFVVITSRDALPGLVAREGARRIDLNLLPLAEATALLRTLIGQRADEEPAATRALAGLCARLPLALRIAAELVNSRRGARIGALVTELADERLDFLDAGADTETAVRSVFSWSYRHLPEPTARVFRLMGLLPGHNGDVHAIAALTDLPVGTARKLVGELVRANLTEESTDGRYRMHDLLGVYAAELAAHHEDDAGRQAAQRRLFDYYLDSAAAAVAIVTSTQGKQSDHMAGPTSWPDDSGAASWLDAERLNFVAIVTAFGTHWPARAVRMSTTVADYLNSYAYDSDALALHTHALAAAQSLNDRIEECHALYNLGRTYRRLGKYQKATECHKQSLTLAQETGKRLEACRTSNELGITYRRLGKYQHAVECHQQALALAREIGTQADAGRALNDLGITYRRLGHYQQAVEHHEQALAIHRGIGNLVGEANAHTSLGIACRRLGQHQRAVEHHQHALALHRRIGNRVGEASALTRLGMVHERLHRGHEALDYFTQALAIHRATGNKPQEGRSLNNLGIAHRKLGHCQEAVEHLQEALTIHEVVGNRIDEGHALHALGVTFQLIERYPESVHHLDRSLAAHRATGNRVEEGHVLNTLGITERKRGRHGDAINLHEQALAIARETSNHELKTETLRDLGDLVAMLGRGDDARRHWQEALTGFTDLDAPDANDIRSRLRALNVQEAGSD